MKNPKIGDKKVEQHNGTTSTWIVRLCPVCDGKGAYETDYRYKTCWLCHGIGKTEEMQ